MPQLRLASWNVNSLKVRLPQVLEWLELSRTDALVLQETKLTDDLFPTDAFLEAPSGRPRRSNSTSRGTPTTRSGS